MSYPSYSLDTTGQREFQMTLANLPRWDLTDFYKNTQDPTIQRDLNTTKDKVSKFVENYAGKLTSGQSILSAIKD